MIRFIVLFSLIFSTVGITIVNCACPQEEVKQITCRECNKDGIQKTKSCCPDCTKHLVLKSDFQKPPAEFQPALQMVAYFYSLVASLNTPVYFSTLLQRDDFNTISPGSVEKCALLSTFLI